jgi:hypothetical protein
MQGGEGGSAEGLVEVGEVLGEGTEVMGLVAGCFLAAELAAHSHDELAVGLRHVRLLLSEQACRGQGVTCQGGQDRHGFAGREPAVDNLGGSLDHLLHGDSHRQDGMGSGIECAADLVNDVVETVAM